jgi:hypothetical protein
MRDTIVGHIKTLADAHGELAESLPDDAFVQKMSARSNPIGAQFWCVVGARESYTKAIESDAWVGFSCSLPGSATAHKTKVVEALSQSVLAFEKVVGNVDWTGTRDDLLLNLLEHEAQHQGQLIRYVYALDYTFPESWASRWALS